MDSQESQSVYLAGSDNNRADTVLDAFINVTQEYGLPSRVRSDKGGEDTTVDLFMLEHPFRGPGREKGQYDHG